MYNLLNPVNKRSFMEKQSTFGDAGFEKYRKKTRPNEWYFGIKMHIGVDSKTGVVHSVATSAALTH